MENHNRMFSIAISKPTFDNKKSLKYLTTQLTVNPLPLLYRASRVHNSFSYHSSDSTSYSAFFYRRRWIFVTLKQRLDDVLNTALCDNWSYRNVEHIEIDKLETFCIICRFINSMEIKTSDSFLYA